MKLDQAGYSDVRTSPVREDRKAAMSAFFGALGGFSRTLGMTMNSSVQRSLFYSRRGKLEQPRGGAERAERAGVGLHASRRGVNRHLPTFHRYLRLRKKMMGITDDLHYYDLYAPLVADVNLRYTPEEAQKHIIAAMAPLG